MARSPRLRFAATSVAVVATLALAACGGDDDDDTSATDATVVATVDESVPTADTSETADTTDSSDETVAPDVSGGGEVGERDEYVEAAEGEVGFDDADINSCVAAAIVSDDVYDAIVEAGLPVEEFRENGPQGLPVDEAQAEAVAVEMADCGDLISQVLTSDDQLACAEGNVSNEQIAEFLSFSLFGLDPSAEVTAASEAVDECLSPTATTTS